MKAMRLAAVAALVALSCGTAAAQSQLRIGLAEDPDVLDPSLARTYVGRIVFASICDKLFDIDAKLNVIPQLALSNETSPDGKTVTIKLRPNVKFHDGEKFDAEAAKFSLERHLTMQGSFRKPELAAIDTVEVADPLTIKLHLKTPFSPLIAQLTDRAGMMVSPKAAKEAGDKFGLKPVCAGPYKFVERVQQDRIVVEKFADYWDKDRLHIDRITYLPIVDSTVRLANLRSGADQGSRRADADHDRLHGAARRRKQSGIGGGAGDGGGGGLRPEDPRDRVRNVAQSRRAGRLSNVLHRLERTHRSGRHYLHFREDKGAAECHRLLSSGRRQGARRRAAHL